MRDATAWPYPTLARELCLPVAPDDGNSATNGAAVSEQQLLHNWSQFVGEPRLLFAPNLQEARLSREAEICYLTLALVTDYDSWRRDGEEVDVGEILENLRQGTRTAAALIRESLARWPAERGEARRRSTTFS